MIGFENDNAGGVEKFVVELRKSRDYPFLKKKSKNVFIDSNYPGHSRVLSLPENREAEEGKKFWNLRRWYGIWITITNKSIITWRNVGKQVGISGKQHCGVASRSFSIIFISGNELGAFMMVLTVFLFAFSSLERCVIKENWRMQTRLLLWLERHCYLEIRGKVERFSTIVTDW